MPRRHFADRHEVTPPFGATDTISLLLQVVAIDTYPAGCEGGPPSFARPDILRMLI
jgi:hypothetical protein